MYLRNEKLFLIALAISIVCNIVFWILYIKNIWEVFSEWVMLAAYIASILCGAIPIVFSSFPSTWKKFEINNIFGAVWVLFIAAGSFIVAALGFIALPGVIALIGYGKYGMDD